MRSIGIIFILFTILFISNEVEGNSVAIQWNNLVLNTVKVAKTAPPVVSRILYIVHNAMYDAWAAYDNVALGVRFGDQLRRPLPERTIENKNKAISYAAFVAFNDLYPQFVSNSTELMISLRFDPNDTLKTLNTPSGIGNTAAFTLLKFRHGDGSNQLGDLHPGAYSDYTGYTPTNTPTQLIDPNLWQPLSVPNATGQFVTQKYAVPHWYTVKTFANDIWPNITAPYKYPSSEYTEQAEELLSYYANLTDERKVIAEYWAGGPGSVTPPGIWNLYAQYVSKRENYDLDKDVKLLFLLNAALMDASIVCWGAKRYYNSVRPISAIRFLYAGKTIKSWVNGQGTKDIMGENWSPYQDSNAITPPFPSFYSGHSTFSAAAANILKSFTGSDQLGYNYTFKSSTSTIELGTPTNDINISYSTFTSAAQDAGISRIYGGIHFQTDNVNGLFSGDVIAQNVFNRGMELINGTSFYARNTMNFTKTSSSKKFSVNLLLIFVLQLIISLI